MFYFCSKGAFVCAENFFADIQFGLIFSVQNVQDWCLTITFVKSVDILL